MPGTELTFANYYYRRNQMELLYYALGSLISPTFLLLLFALIVLSATTDEKQSTGLNKDTYELLKRRNVQRTINENLFL